MKKVVALPAPEPRSVYARNIAWAYAAVLTVMVIAQLFAFEKFIPLMRDYYLPGGRGTASLVACVIVFVEIFALPFLLRMRLSPLMRWFSLVCSVAAPVIWLALAIYDFAESPFLENGGILGAKVAIPAILQLDIAAVLTVTALFVAYGLWPNSKK